MKRSQTWRRQRRRVEALWTAAIAYNAPRRISRLASFLVVYAILSRSAKRLPVPFPFSSALIFFFYLSRGRFWQVRLALPRHPYVG